MQIVTADDAMWLSLSIRHVKEHVLPKWLTSHVIADLTSRYALDIESSAIEPIDSIVIDLPGPLIIGEPYEKFTIDSLMIEIRSHDFSSFKGMIDRSKERTSGSNMCYHKIKWNLGCLVLSKEQHEKISEYCDRTFKNANERADRFYETYASKKP